MPPPTSLTIETVEMHTGGEPVRIPACAGTVAGYPPIPGATLLAKRRQARERLDHLRRLLMSRPSGHFDMYGVIPVAPDPPRRRRAPGRSRRALHAQRGLQHPRRPADPCGRAVIALGRWAVDSGRVPRREPETPVVLQCACGPLLVPH